MKRVVFVTTCLVALLAAGDRLDPIREGLSGTYYANASWSDPPAAVIRDPQPSTARLTAAWHGAPPPRFSATWTGWLFVSREGSYTLATVSDGGSWVYVDGEALVDNGAPGARPRGASGSLALTRGVHAIYVRYAREDGSPRLDLLWARAGEPLAPIPARSLTPRRPSVWSFALSALMRQSLGAAERAWVATMVIWALTWAWAQIKKCKAWLERARVWRLMRWILAASLLLNVVGIWWGLPGGSWAPDELTPILVMDGAARWFAHGWFDRYPPLQFYVMTAAFSPLLLLQWLGQVDLSAATPYAGLTLVSRVISVAGGIGTLLAIYASGARAFGARAGVFAAAAFACVIPFVYYAKTANLDVPYLFWFALSLVFYLRALESLTPGDLIGFAVCATLAICTKDQAYGLYLLTPFAIVERMWRANREAGTPRPLMRALLDRRLALAAAVACLIFVAVHNLAFNVRGFQEHLRYITGGGSETYRDFEPTIGGRIALLRLSVNLVRASWGWPMFLVSLAGVAVASLTPRHRRVAVWLALPVVSYYLGFIDVVLYNYDRFMLPVCLVLSLFAGLACDRWLSPGGRARTWRHASAVVVFAVTWLYAATVDLVMIRDSRYTVEQWLAGHAGPTDRVGFVFPPQYYPRLERFNATEITSLEQLRQAGPAYYVLNADYALAEPTGTGIGRLIADLQNGTSGYSLAFRYRQPAPWPWLPGAPRDLVSDRNNGPVTSVLRHIDPWYEVFRRSN